MTANRFQNPNEQFLDATGQPYSGGFLYFYSSGTSTPLATYSDSGLSIANTNPIVLDSAGRAGSIFLQAQLYKVVLKDSSGVQIWTEDPVSDPIYNLISGTTTFVGSDASGSANAIVVSTTSPSSFTFAKGNRVTFRSSFTNTTAATLDVALSGIIEIKKRGPSGVVSLTGGEIIASEMVTVVSDGTYWELDSEVRPIFPNPTTIVAGDLLYGSSAGTLSRLAKATDGYILVQASGLPSWVSKPLAAPAGAVVNSVLARYTATTALTVVLPEDATIPQVGEGTQILSVSITPSSNTSKLRARFKGSVSATSPIWAVAALFANGAANALAADLQYVNTANGVEHLVFEYEWVPGSTSAQTITLRVGPGAAGTIYMNQSTAASQNLGGTVGATLIVEEIAP